MTKKALIVLAICLVMAAGIVAYVWANGCCEEDNLCKGGHSALGDCDFLFTVDHDRETGGGSHEVTLYIKKFGGPEYTAFTMATMSLYPYPVCVTYGKELNLDANSTYVYYFACNDCDPASLDGPDDFNTGDCD